VPRVIASIEIDRAPEDAFAVVADPVRRRRLLPDNFRDVRVISETQSGPGTRTSFRIVTPQGDHATEIDVIAWDPPRTLTEQARGTNPYTMHWRFEPAEHGARVSIEMDYAGEGTILHRLIERWFARRALEQSLLVELLRLKQIVEGA
jgi:ribosome-associated toxin RatA of RatAB toxin-antitoxin module